MSNARTINLPGSGNATQQYELAPGLLQYVQAVYVEVDNTAGSTAQPTLTISEQSGVVIAKKRQGEAIPAAGSGSATWALRLDDNGGDIRYNRINTGGWLSVHTTSDQNPDGGGISFVAEQQGFGVIVTDLVYGSIFLQAPFFFLDALGGIYRITNSSLFDVSSDAVNFNVGGGGFAIQTDNPGGFSVDGLTTHRLFSGQSVEIRDAGDALIFRFDEDGSVHGLASVGAITWDL